MSHKRKFSKTDSLAIDKAFLTGSEKRKHFAKGLKHIFLNYIRTYFLTPYYIGVVTGCYIVRKAKDFIIFFI